MTGSNIMRQATLGLVTEQTPEADALEANKTLLKLESLHIKNFRAFKDLAIEKLGRVNLIVGKNNCGKSSLLEAVQVYATKADPQRLYDIAREKDELDVKFVDSMSEINEQVTFRHFFHGREYSSVDDCRIVISGGLNKDLIIEHVFFQVFEIENGEQRSKRRKFIKKSEIDESFIDDLSEALFVAWQDSKDQTEDFDTNLILLPPDDRSTRLSSRVISTKKKSSVASYSFVPTTFLKFNSMAGMLDAVLPYENERSFIFDALKIIDERIEFVHFVERQERGVRYSSRRSPLVKIKDHDALIPLKSMGEGMLKILQLVLSLLSAKDGFLLIDEIENGLHYSIQDKVWQMLFEKAAELNVQIFATTHSRDIIESFSRVASNHPEEGVLVSLGRSIVPEDDGLIFAETYSEEALAHLIAVDLEVR